MKKIEWHIDAANGPIIAEVCSRLDAGGGAVVTPTKVGYIIITTDYKGLKRKFQLKNRPERKPGVVLLSSIHQLRTLAQVTPDIVRLYENCWNSGTLLGCILPWQPEAAKLFIPADGSEQLMQDARHTSCFVIKYGTPSELICEEMWVKHGKLVFASSANPSGKGNRGRFDGIGEQIIEGVDLAVECDEYVHQQQPAASEEERYAQGVMVSMVDDDGKLTHKAPAIIRAGLALEEIRNHLTAVFACYENRLGGYH